MLARALGEGKGWLLCPVHHVDNPECFDCHILVLSFLKANCKLLGVNDLGILSLVNYSSGLPLETLTLYTSKYTIFRTLFQTSALTVSLFSGHNGNKYVVLHSSFERNVSDAAWFPHLAVRIDLRNVTAPSCLSLPTCINEY